MPRRRLIDNKCNVSASAWQAPHQKKIITMFYLTILQAHPSLLLYFFRGVVRVQKMV